jgi:hypothetical protein
MAKDLTGPRMPSGGSHGKDERMLTCVGIGKITVETKGMGRGCGGGQRTNVEMESWAEKYGSRENT